VYKPLYILSCNVGVAMSVIFNGKPVELGQLIVFKPEFARGKDHVGRVTFDVGGARRPGIFFVQPEFTVSEHQAVLITIRRGDKVVDKHQTVKAGGKHSMWLSAREGESEYELEIAPQLNDETRELYPVTIVFSI
jgi:hypothetical protein